MLRGIRGRPYGLTTTPAPTAAAGHFSALQIPVSPAPPWHNQDGVCVDTPYSWRDQRGDTCQDYAKKQFCKTDGSYGAGWWQVWGTFDAFATQNHSAASACCDCGGGQLSCCKSYRELEAHIRATLVPFVSYVSQLKSWLKSQVAANGAVEETRLNTSLDAWKVTFQVSLVDNSSDQRQKYLARNRERSEELLAHNGSVKEAVRHEIALAGYAAARGAVIENLTRINQGVMMKQAYSVLRRFREAAQAWESVRNRSRAVARRGEEAWAEYYADPNKTWAAIRGSVDHANRFADGAAVARQAIRRSKQATRVATDLAEFTREGTELLEAQVRMAQDRSQRALRATSANAGKLDDLEAMVAEAEEGTRLVS